jgi:YidC/Oxa1 family membrane protein insertase
MKTMNIGSSDNKAANSMTNSMNLMMPIMSLVMCFSFPAGLGIYWIMTAVFQIFQNIIMNKYYDNVDMEKLIAENMEKASKKKKKKSFTQKMMEKAGMEQPAEAAGSINTAASTKTKNYARNYDNSKADEISYSSANAPKAKPGSLAEKAGLVREYNERNNKGGRR